ncbi:MAG: hypothetical protein J5942_00735 [Prevotella sp.]|nr:hypothetical protein [Prevotella sp.]
MKKYLLLALITLMPLISMAQNTSKKDLPHIVTSKGTVVAPVYKVESNSLELNISNNTDETVEIIVTHRGMPIYYDTSIFEEDKVEVDIPKQLVDETAVFVRSGNETHYVGNINKKEE